MGTPLCLEGDCFVTGPVKAWCKSIEARSALTAARPAAAAAISALIAALSAPPAAQFTASVTVALACDPLDRDKDLLAEPDCRLDVNGVELGLDIEPSALRALDPLFLKRNSASGGVPDSSIPSVEGELSSMTAELWFFDLLLCGRVGVASVSSPSLWLCEPAGSMITFCNRRKQQHADAHTALQTQIAPMAIKIKPQIHKAPMVESFSTSPCASATCASTLPAAKARSAPI